MEFVEAPLFTQLVGAYLGDDDYRELQRQLAQNPQTGEVIPGTGGFRKLRGGTLAAARASAAGCA